MDDLHRQAIKKELRVLTGYLRVVASWLDAEYPASAYAVMQQTRPLCTSLENALRVAANQSELQFGPAEDKEPEKVKMVKPKKTGGK